MQSRSSDLIKDAIPRLLVSQGHKNAYDTLRAELDKAKKGVIEDLRVHFGLTKPKTETSFERDNGKFGKYFEVLAEAKKLSVPNRKFRILATGGKV